MEEKTQSNFPRMKSQTIYENAPIEVAGSLERYIEYGCHPGSFLTAVLENNLFEAFARADYVNQHNMFNIVSWIYNNAPITCHGSKEIVIEHIAKRKKELAT